MRLQDANIQNAERTHQQPSRLNRYFKIKNKVVRQDYISFQVYPDLPLLREYYETNEFVEFVVNEEQRVGNDIQLNIKMLTHKKESLSGRIEISRHEMGSLLKFYIMKSTYNPVVVDLFLRTFKLAKITFNEESDAAKQTVKETR